MLTENGKKILEKAEEVILRKFDECLSSQEPITDAAMAASPWVWRLQQADMCATFVDEREEPEE